MQFYAGHTESKDGSSETIKFFLNCLCLLLGRFDSKKFESVVSEYGMRISQVLVPQVIIEVLKKISMVYSLIGLHVLLPCCIQLGGLHVVIYTPLICF